MRGGSKAVWNFSKYSSDLVAGSFRKDRILHDIIHRSLITLCTYYWILQQLEIIAWLLMINDYKMHRLVQTWLWHTWRLLCTRLIVLSWLQRCRVYFVESWLMHIHNAALIHFHSSLRCCWPCTMLANTIHSMMHYIAIMHLGALELPSGLALHSPGWYTYTMVHSRYPCVLCINSLYNIHVSIYCVHTLCAYIVCIYFVLRSTAYILPSLCTRALLRRRRVLSRIICIDLLFDWGSIISR